MSRTITDNSQITQDISVSGQLKFNLAAPLVLSTNALELRNTTNAQALQVDNTYTDSTHFEAATFDFTTTANVLSIGTIKGSSGGSVRNLQLLVGGTVKLDFGITTGNTWTFSGNIVTNGFVNPTSGIQVSGNMQLLSSGGDVGLSSNSGGKYGWGARSGTINLNASADAVLGWTGTNAAVGFGGVDGTVDAAVSRVGSGVLGVGNGMQGDTSGTIRVGALRIDVTPTAVSSGTTMVISSAGDDATHISHRISVNMNGTTYWIPASTVAF